MTDSHAPDASRTSAGSPAGDWFRDAFSHDYLRIYAHRDAGEAAATIQALVRLVDLPPGAPVLDLACGFGRHLRVLRDAGLNAYGLDLSGVLLSHAAQHAALRGRLVRADMRALPFRDGAFAFVGSFFSSFGYFADDQENLRVLQEIRRVLRPGSRLLMDFLNADLLRRTLVPEDQRQMSGFHLIQRRWIDRDRNSVEKDLIVTDEHGERRYHESVKLYELPDFQRLFKAAGLTLEAAYGAADGTPFTADSPRLVLVARA